MDRLPHRLACAALATLALAGCQETRLDGVTARAPGDTAARVVSAPTSAPPPPTPAAHDAARTTPGTLEIEVQPSASPGETIEVSGLLGEHEATGSPPVLHLRSAPGTLLRLGTRAISFDGEGRATIALAWSEMIQLARADLGHMGTYHLAIPLQVQAGDAPPRTGELVLSSGIYNYVLHERIHDVYGALEKGEPLALPAEAAPHTVLLLTQVSPVPVPASLRGNGPPAEWYATVIGAAKTLTEVEHVAFGRHRAPVNAGACTYTDLKRRIRRPKVRYDMTVAIVEARSGRVIRQQTLQPPTECPFHSGTDDRTKLYFQVGRDQVERHLRELLAIPLGGGG